jgi:5-methylcytosine-specific restriction enzyme A
MRTFLVTWNPWYWQWEDLATAAASVANGQPYTDRWSCGMRKDIHAGERLILLRQGKEPRGIIGAGWATSETYEGEHWKEGHAGMANYVKMRFDSLVDSDSDPESVLRVESLPESLEEGIHWRTQASGIVVPAALVEALEIAWARHLGSSAAYDDEISALEGQPRYQLVLHRRRERQLREAKIAAALATGDGRLRCEVPGCGFDFFEVYGKLGRHYAQVHHREALGRRRRATRTALANLAIICANCHVMVHRGGDCRPLEGLLKRRKR